MKNRILSSIVLAVVLLLCGFSAQSKQDIRTLLRQQGFDWTLSGRGVTLRKICTISVSGNRHDFYHYTHVDLTREAGHQIDVLIAIRDGKTYLGTYSLPPVTARCDMRSKEMLFTADYGKIYRFAITSSGLPTRMLIDGELEEFYPAKQRNPHP